LDSPDNYFNENRAEIIYEDRWSDEDKDVKIKDKMKTIPEAIHSMNG
jgi:hypothetical protein